MAVKLLIRSQSLDDFQDIFSATFEPVGPADLPTLLQMGTVFYKKYSAQPSTYNLKTQKEDFSRLDAKTKAARFLLADQIAFLSQKASPLIQRPRVPGDAALDLSNAALTASDIRGADLRNANLSGVVFTFVRMDGCDLGGNVKFDQSEFYDTAWWRASHMSGALLSYLKQHEPFSPLAK